jgi:hypothetical protein
VTRWGRLIFYVTDVDALWTHLSERGLDPEIPQDASWGERYFHMPDSDGHELSFARPLQQFSNGCMNSSAERRSLRRYWRYTG